jgi:hypothetical protein
MRPSSLELGIKCCKERQWRAGINHLMQAYLEVDSATSVWVDYWVAICYWGEGQSPTNVIDALLRGYEKDPEHPAIIAMIAAFKGERGESWAEVSNWCEKLLQADKNSSRAWTIVGQLAANAKKTAVATAAASRAIQLDCLNIAAFELRAS